jgi:hypothetical protein
MSWHRHKGKLVLNRRTLLRGAFGGAAISLALPPLEAMFNSSGTAYALDGILPKRFGLFFWGNGNRPELWTPTGTGDGGAWSLSTTLQPLASIKSKLLVVTGTAVKLPNDSPHSSGAAGVLTAHPLGDPADEDSYNAPSIDQIIAEEIGNDTLYRSLETGVTGSGLSYNGPNSKNPAETDPIAFYNRVFGETFREPGDTTIDPKLGLRRSILDGVMGDIETLKTQVGTADKTRLEQHLDGLRDLELRLSRLEEDPPDLEACIKPPTVTGDYAYIDGRPQLTEVNQVMVEMLAMAMACDQSRVFSHWFSDPVNGVLFPGATAGHHDLTHNEGGDQPEVAAITLQCIEAYAALLNAFEAIPEGSGTLLDNCVILGTSEVSLGQTHSILDMPILIGGSACGALKQDHHYQSLGAENCSKVLLSLMQALDITVTSIGVDEGLADTPLSAMFA